MYFLDTNICIYALKDTFPLIKEKMAEKPPSEIAVPAIVKAELYYGALKSKRKKKVLTVLSEFLSPLAVVPFGEKEAVLYAKIRASLEQTGSLIGPNDLIIASTAAACGATLVTANTREFKRVKGLLLEDWTGR